MMAGGGAVMAGGGAVMAGGRRCSDRSNRYFYIGGGNIVVAVVEWFEG